MIDCCYPDFEELMSFLCGNERNIFHAQFPRIGHMLIGKLFKKGKGNIHNLTACMSGEDKSMSIQ